MQGEDVRVTASGAVDTRTKTGADAEESSVKWIDRLTAAACGEDGTIDDELLLELIQEHLEVAKVHARRVRDLRDEAMVRRRAAGVSNLDLTKATGLSDSGISRRIIAAGGKRRVNRRNGPNDRRTGAPERRSGGSS